MASVSCGSWARRAKEAGPPSVRSFHEFSKVSAQEFLLYEATMERTLEILCLPYGCYEWVHRRGMIHKVGTENDEWCAKGTFALGEGGQVVLCAKSVKRDLI